MGMKGLCAGVVALSLMVGMPIAAQQKPADEAAAEKAARDAMAKMAAEQAEAGMRLRIVGGESGPAGGDAPQKTFAPSRHGR